MNWQIKTLRVYIKKIYTKICKRYKMDIHALLIRDRDHSIQTEVMNY